MRLTILFLVVLSGSTLLAKTDSFKKSCDNFKKKVSDFRTKHTEKSEINLKNEKTLKKLIKWYEDQPVLKKTDYDKSISRLMTKPFSEGKFNTLMNTLSCDFFSSLNLSRVLIRNSKNFKGLQRNIREVILGKIIQKIEVENHALVGIAINAAIVESMISHGILEPKKTIKRDLSKLRKDIKQVTKLINEKHLSVFGEYEKKKPNKKKVNWEDGLYSLQLEKQEVTLLNMRLKKIILAAQKGI